MDRHLFVDHEDFAEFVFDTSLARLAAQATDSETVRIYFEGIEGSTVQTSFIVDDVTLTVQ